VSTAAELGQPFTHRSRRMLDRMALANDASHFLLVPQQIVRAEDAADVARILAEASQSGSSVTFRSGGTSLSGQSVTDQVLVDARRHFQRIQVLDGGTRVRVQPGATVRQVNTRLLRHGRKLGPDPASEGACTIGGVMANNSSGMSCGTALNTYSTIESAVIVLPSGTVVDTGAADAEYRLRRLEPHLYGGLEELRDWLRSRPVLVAEVRRQFSLKNTMGYALNAFLDADDPTQILTRLMVGSEGTLGFVAEAVIRTVPWHRHAATGLAVFESLAAANDALPALVDSGASALELLDARSLTVASTDPTALATPIAGLQISGHAALLIEYQAADAEQTVDAEIAGAALLSRLPVSTSTFTRDPAERAALWHLRKGLYATVAGARPPGTTALLEDVAVPVAALTHTCEELTGLFDRYGYEDSVIFGHAKDGNIHFMITDRFAEPEPLSRYAAFTEDMVELILSEGGTLKAEHGTGRVMAPFVARQYGPELYGMMRRVKELFDPVGILNPGVIITDDPQLHLRHLKTAPAVEVEVDRCVECGFCEPVCPSRGLTLTPRQRIVLRRHAEAARLAGDDALAAELDEEYEYDGVQTCAVDGMCQTACPVLINTGDLVKRLRRDRHPAVERSMWGAAANHWSAATRVASTALHMAQGVPPGVVTGPNRAARRVLGEERVPLWSRELPGGGFRRARPAVNGRVDAVYFPACVNSMFGPAGDGGGVAYSFELLCARAGIALRVPEGIDGYCCGTPWASKGLTESARRMRDRVIVALRAASEDGRLPVICDASSCTEGLRETLQDVGIVVVDAVEYAATQLLPRLPVPRRMSTLVLHPTCSSTRMGLNAHLSTLAGVVARRVVIPDDWGCCAFAGDRGMLHPELTASATRAQAAEIMQVDAGAHVSCNRTCELGMTRATGHPYRHVLEVLEENTRMPREDV